MTADEAPLILIVEDEMPNLALFKAVLLPRGYRLVTAGTLADARLILATIIPTIVILDVRLTDGSGLSLAEEMKADPRMAAILILAVSASVLAKDLEAIRRAGCDAFLAKPFQPRALSAEVARLVRSRQTPSIILGPDPARSSDATPHP